MQMLSKLIMSGNQLCVFLATAKIRTSYDSAPSELKAEGDLDATHICTQRRKISRGGQLRPRRSLPCPRERIGRGRISIDRGSRAILRFASRYDSLRSRSSDVFHAAAEPHRSRNHMCERCISSDACLFPSYKGDWGFRVRKSSLIKHQDLNGVSPTIVHIPFL